MKPLGPHDPRSVGRHRLLAVIGLRRRLGRRPYRRTIGDPLSGCLGRSDPGETRLLHRLRRRGRAAGQGGSRGDRAALPRCDRGEIRCRRNRFGEFRHQPRERARPPAALPRLGRTLATVRPHPGKCHRPRRIHHQHSRGRPNHGPEPAHRQHPEIPRRRAPRTGPLHADPAHRITHAATGSGPPPGPRSTRRSISSRRNRRRAVRRPLRAHCPASRSGRSRSGWRPGCCRPGS
ncbi:hypothetical protein DFR76_104271 [Nocardia pseudobrasiliensis]|uniref:Uncharacterized protein n=1 Tax=Nocardia pseudobrasiliensis TaxID=45979 RepID=A0A370I8T3_9NOCA|nr:hypothetical protein DFR76_104271 [Nocardia pseudobrasiliensis]